MVGGCSFEQLPCFGILSDAPGGLVRACVGVVGGPCEGNIEHFDKVQEGLMSVGLWDTEHFDKVQEGLRSVGECGSVGY